MGRREIVMTFILTRTNATRRRNLMLELAF
jgi:hypothetical protein